MKATAFDIDILARTIYGEARGASFEGKIAVAHVVLNRARKGGWWGDTIASVCLRSSQFSCWNLNDPNRKKIESIQMGDKVFQECEFAALGAILGHYPDPTSNSCHYHTSSVHPKWATGHTSVGHIGNHIFYNDIK